MHSAAAGELLWKVELASAVFSPITVYQPVDGPQQALIGAQTGHLHCLDASSGAEAWRKHLGCEEGDGGSGAAISTAAAPAVSSGAAWQRCCGASGDGGQGSVDSESCHPAAEPDNAANGAVGSSVAREARSDRVWSCTNAGELVVARRGHMTVAEVRLDSQIFSSPVAFDDVVLFGCRDDQLYCVGLK